MNEQRTPEQPGGRALVRDVKVRYGQSANANETGPHVATVAVDLLDAQTRSTELDALYSDWRERIGRIPGAIALNLQEPSRGPQGVPFGFRLQGDDLERLKSASLALQEALRSFRGTRDVMDDLRPGKPERRLRLAEGARGLGLDTAAVAGQLRAALLGETATEVQVGTESYEITVRQAEDDRDSLGDLDEFTVALPKGGQVPLGAVASIKTGRGWARIQRIDGRRTVTVTGDLDTREGNAMRMIERIQQTALPELRASYPRLDIELRGQSSEAATTGGSVRSAFAFGLVGIFVVLAFQLRSYREPVIVMAVIPFAIVGAVWGHFLLGYPLSMPSLLGAASLAGIVVNDSILLVHFIRQRVANGQHMIDSARLASRDRFRAILLTSLTTIVGLLPLLAEGSLQAQVLKPPGNQCGVRAARGDIDGPVPCAGAL